jgi:homocysteine S-methyltransferase
MEPTFLEYLEEREVVLFDGGNGTELYGRGVFVNRCFDALNLSRPSLVQDVHESFAAVGAEVVETNTFGANRVKLEAHGFGERVAEINRLGVEIARRAVRDRAYVAGAVGPLGIRIEPWGPTSEDEARDLFREQIQALVEAGVELLVLETFSDLPEIHAALRAAKEVAGLPVIAQMTVEEEGVSLEGVRPEWFARKLDEWGADVIGVNCSVGPGALLPVVETMAGVTERPLSVMPNAGNPRSIEGRNIYLCSPEYLATYARRFVQTGARVLGGCCGVSPEHVRAMHRALQAVHPSRPQRRVARVSPESPRGIHPVPLAEKSGLAAKIARGRFVVAVEVLPPRGWEAGSEIESIQVLRDAGVDAVNIPDSPRARARMSPQALAHLVQDRAGLEPILHYTCRDRNLLGMQCDLLGAHALDLRNLMLVTGDPPKMGDYPDATAVFDVDSIGLTNMAARLNHGLSVGGNPIGAPTAFHLGVALNPGALDPDKEISRFEWKVDAGAEFAVTQPIFDAELLLGFLGRIAHVRIPVLVSLWPLLSYRNAEFMRNEVPGVVVPEAVMERMRAAEEGETAAETGIAIAREVLEAVRHEVQGAQIAAPAGRFGTALRVADGYLGGAFRPGEPILPSRDE